MTKKDIAKKWFILFLYTLCFIAFIQILTTKNVFAAPLTENPGLVAPPGISGGTVPTEQQAEYAQKMAQLLVYGQYIINGMLGVGLLTSLGGFIKVAVELAKGGSKARAEAMQNLQVLTFTTAAFGAFPLILIGIVAFLKV
ncbi:MAG: hypothetical protein RSC93_10505 [Erysipelotrichaceae bacterium]